MAAQVPPMKTPATVTEGSGITDSSIASLDLQGMRDSMAKAGQDGMSGVLKFVDELPKKGIMSIFDDVKSFALFYMLVALSAYIIFVGSVLVGSMLAIAGAVLFALIVTLSIGVSSVLTAASVGLMCLGMFVVMTAVPALLLFVAVNIARSMYEKTHTMIQKL